MKENKDIDTSINQKMDRKKKKKWKIIIKEIILNIIVKHRKGINQIIQIKEHIQKNFFFFFMQIYKEMTSEIHEKI